MSDDLRPLGERLRHDSDAVRSAIPERLMDAARLPHRPARRVPLAALAAAPVLALVLSFTLRPTPPPRAAGPASPAGADGDLADFELAKDGDAVVLKLSRSGSYLVKRRCVDSRQVQTFKVAGTVFRDPVVNSCSSLVLYEVKPLG